MFLLHIGNELTRFTSQRDINDLQDEMNDASEVLSITVLHQPTLHGSLTARLAGEPINVDLDPSLGERLRPLT